MESEDRELSRLADSVADGEKVDWEAEEEAHPHLGGRLRRLRDIESIASAHWTPLAETSDADEDGDTDSTETPIRPRPVPPPPPDRWGHLQIIRQIGQGGFGEVYLAKDARLDRDVALKLIRSSHVEDKARKEAFLGEARKLARVDHENVLKVHGADEHDGRVGLWTDMVEGMTLEQSLERDGAFHADEAIRYGIVLCSALAEVHAAGLVHRDVKTSNVMRRKGGKIVLMDFSSVVERKPTRASSAQSPLTGTPLYMAPEQFHGEDSGTSLDIYALGVLLYRLVTRRFPIEAESFSELAEKHKRGELLPLADARPDAPEGFVDVVEKALRPDPEKRYRSAGEMKQALRVAIGERPPIDDPHKPWWDLHKHKLAVAAGLLIVATILTIWLWPPPFEVQATLFRVGRDFEERLHPGGRVIPGDKLRLEIQGSRRVWVYVLDQDQKGRTVVLFPLPDLDLQNPLSPGEMHILPGSLDGSEHAWRVTAAGERETISVLASTHRLLDFERQIEIVRQARPGAPVQLPPVAHEELREIAGLAPVDTGGSSEGSIAEVMREIGIRGPTGIRTWIIDLESVDP